MMTNIDENIEELAQDFESPLEIAYAPLWRRFVALIADLFILYAVTLVMKGIVPFCLFFSAFMNPDPAAAEEAVMDVMGFMKWGAVVGVVVYWLYSVLTEGSVWQATVGKKAVRICVTDTAGNQISPLRSAVRAFVKYLPLLLFSAGQFVLLGSIVPEFKDAGFWLFPALLCAAAVAFVVDASPSLGVKRRALHDFIAGTMVVEEGLFRQAQ